MDQELDLRSYVAVVRRRYLYFLLPALAIAVLSVATAYLLPSSYQASATILVESQQIPTDLAAPTVTATVSERINVIKQRLMTRENLLQIARKFSLFGVEDATRSPTSIVEDMRAATAIEQIDVATTTRTRDSSIIGFTVAFEYRDPTTASRVTNELVQSILSQNIQTRLGRATETSTFIQQQLNQLEQRLLGTEARLASFKKENEGALPETLESRRAQLEQLNSKIAELDQRLVLNGGSNSTLLIPGGGELEQLNFDLTAKKINLEAFEKRRRDVEPLVNKGFFPKNQLTELDRQIAVTKVEISSTEAKIAALGGVTDNSELRAALTAQLDQLKDQAKALAQTISQTPTIQFELNGLMREYENLQNEYRQTQAKLEAASTGERLEQDRQAERFEVIEQASPPTEPTKPNRPRIVMAGSFGGVALGVVLVVLLEILDKSLRTAADVERYTGLKPIAVIPYVKTWQEGRRRRWRVALMLFLLTGLISAAALAVHVYYLPLDFLAERLWQKAHSFLVTSGLLAQ